MRGAESLSGSSFICEFWWLIFQPLRRISLYWWVTCCIRKLRPDWKESYHFTDSWVLARLFSAIFLFAVSSSPSLWWLERLAVLYGLLMVIEAFVYEINLLIFWGYELAKVGDWLFVLSYRRLVITSLQNYAAIMFWFALLYRHWDSCFAPVSAAPGLQPPPIHPFLSWFTLSFRTMTTFGWATLAPIAPCGSLLTLLQSAIGLLMALLIVVSFVRLLPKPSTRERSEGGPYALYNPDVVRESAASRRPFWMSKISKQSLTLAAAIGAFAVSALSLFLAYGIFADLTPGGEWVAVVQSLVGVCFLAFGMAMTGVAAHWLTRH